MESGSCSIAHQPQPRKVVPLATICVPTRMFTSPACTDANSAGAALLARAVGVDAQDARLGKEFGQVFLDPLRAAAHGQPGPGRRNRGRRGTGA